MDQHSKDGQRNHEDDGDTIKMVDIALYLYLFCAALSNPSQATQGNRGSFTLGARIGRDYDSA